MTTKAKMRINIQDVEIVNPQTGEVLTYNAATGKWENDAVGGGDVYGDPAGVDGHMVLFDTDGYHLIDGGVPGGPGGGADILEVQVFS